MASASAGFIPGSFPNYSILLNNLGTSLPQSFVSIERSRTSPLTLFVGVSSRFLNTLQGLDQKYHATDKAKSVDQSYGVTQKTNSILSGLTSYYEKAAGTPTGQKFVNFYTQTSRQVQDIHTEARRLADLKKQEGTQNVPGTDKTTCKCASDTDKCPCAPGACACADCPKSNVKDTGNNKTTCDCGGSSTNCSCAPNRCACQACPKAVVKVKDAGNDKTTCTCGGDDKNCLCDSGKCACKGCSQ